jgi:hypothetical protein
MLCASANCDMLQPIGKAMLRVSFFAVAFSALLALGTQALAQVAKQDLPLFPRYADKVPTGSHPLQEAVFLRSNSRK